MESENQLLECEAAERECKEKCRYVLKVSDVSTLLFAVSYLFTLFFVFDSAYLR